MPRLSPSELGRLSAKKKRATIGEQKFHELMVRLGHSVKDRSRAGRKPKYPLERA